MNINNIARLPCFRKTLLASLLVPLLTPLYSWAAQTVSVTDGNSVAILGEYGTDSDNLSPVSVQGSTSEVTGGSDVAITTTGRGANGANVTNGGTLTLNGSAIKTDGVVAFGISNNKGTVNLQGGDGDDDWLHRLWCFFDGSGEQCGY
ncbi:putative autotransporter protein [Yersinia enterocolitica subsp. enterocolitica]|nr:putative autotransporter protein [Yersinia enterocolitica subsp. enterocolitica]